MICRGALDDARQIQRINYLKAAGTQVCPRLDFGKPRLVIGRVAHDR
jgi:hypothetical protein